MGVGCPELVDLCCGAGGFSCGFKQAGWKVLLGADLCTHSLSTFRRNLRSETLCVDLMQRGAVTAIKQVLGHKSPNAVIAGPPCQGFSRAGRRRMVDPRNEVILAAARIAVSLEPEIIVFENVRNIMTPRYEQFLFGAIHTLRRKGYSVSYRIVNASHFSVPQDRERLIIVGSQNTSLADIDLVLQDIAMIRSAERTVSEALQGIPLYPALNAGGVSLPNHIPMKHSLKVQQKIARIRPGDGPLSYRKLDPVKQAATLICGNRALPCHYAVNRTITVREAARLQGFADSFVFEGPVGKQMLQVANSVPPPLAMAVGRRIKKFIQSY